MTMDVLAQVPSRPDWDQAPPFGRRGTILFTLQRLYTLHPWAPCIVETGTLRDDAPQAIRGDGWSTVAWGWYCAQTGGQAVTVDISPEAMAICRQMTASYAPCLEYVVADSVGFLRHWGAAGRGRIYLLYLDSLDYHDQERSEAHCLAEAQAALPWLASPCLVLLDDTSPTNQPGNAGIPALTGKGARAVPYLVECGFRVELMAESQVLLSRGAG